MDNKLGSKTGFTCCRRDIHVGSLISHHSGYCGFYKVEERKNGYWLVDAHYNMYGHPSSSPLEDMLLDRDLGAHFQLCDWNNPYLEPDFDIYCSQCDEVLCGEVTVEGDFTWNDNLARYEDKPDGIFALCKLCEQDPTRKYQPSGLEVYLQEQYEKAGVRVLEIPIFRSKEEIDQWIGLLKSLQNMFSDELFNEDDKTEE